MVVSLCKSGAAFSVEKKIESENFRLKHFANESTKHFYLKKLKPNFHHTYTVKPDASRGESSEYYWVARGFRGAYSDARAEM